MLYGKIQDIIQHKDSYQNVLVRIFNALEKKDINPLAVGTHDIDGYQMVIVKYTTRPSTEKTSESHRKNIDLHIMLEGSEKIGVGKINNKNVVTAEYKELTDSILYGYVENMTFIDMQKGTYAVFFPDDIHNPGCNPGTYQENVKKAIIKIPASEWVFEKGDHQNTYNK